MTYPVINFQKEFQGLSEFWSPEVIAQMNEYHLKVAKIQGDFVWHRHTKTDEVFIVIEGELRIDFRDGSALLQEGEMLVVPRGTEHKPYAETVCKILLIEPAGTASTGDSDRDFPDGTEVWT